ncbi:MAG: hypothetical protein IEMM0002_0662 [bacterium]|nr:MAG: hypothetical protein IEMM0002_0662 [bacterium]
MKYFITAIGLLFLLAQASVVHATPSTQIWIPSTDIQDYGVVHLGADNYNTISTAPASGGSSLVNYGLTVGAFSNETVGLEVGIDWREASEDPLYLNAKAGLPEGAMFGGSPEFAFGGYEFGTKSNATDYNILYGLVAKTFGDAGRFSAGFYSGNDKLLVDKNGEKDASGVLLSFDRSFGEKFWGAIDYMGGENIYGAFSFGVSYALSDKSSFLVGYDIYNNSDIKNTMTFQLDVNF